MKITIIIATAILSTIIAVTGGYNFPETVLLTLMALVGVMSFIALWNMSERMEAEAELKEILREALMEETRAREKELFKRDRKVKDTKTIKKIAKE